ncbi:hypothetical protein ACJMK2_031721 [Sinanodonta woodiana]|uniref:Mab-21-like nucleotidyltransferase domain-containing protein n=1 Tax=Sinanodonta woodiana TaxID=1069815 RepID=A0ABD3X1S0_SINWO
MASMNKQWKQVQRSDWVQEYFMIGEFIQSDNWEISSPPSFNPNNYPYLKDCIEIRGNQYGREINNEIPVTEITHGTSCENMLSIIKDGGFRPDTKYIPGIGHMDLVWFGLKIGETEIDYVKENYRLNAQDQYRLPASTVGKVVSHFASTAPFQPMSRYGNIKFTLSIRDVLQEYKTQFGNGRLEMRKLGTFAYKMETMHVILVCPPHTQTTGKCPLLVDDPVMQPDEDFDVWTWRPHSTGDQRVSVQISGSVFTAGKRWEHVVFAFFVPMGHCLRIANLNDHVSLCLWKDMYRDVYDVNAAIQTMLELITHKKQFIRKSLANIIIRMIRKYIAEMHLYEKISDLDQRQLLIDREYVEHKLRELLKMTNRSFNWSPHKVWLN